MIVRVCYVWMSEEMREAGFVLDEVYDEGDKGMVSKYVQTYYVLGVLSVD